MFYYCIKILTRCSLLFFLRKKITCGPSLKHVKGPAIIASNHPNSMLDAAIIACLCKQPIHFTIRSDMFNNPLFRFLLHYLHGIPIYRASEEKRKIKGNYQSIARCTEVLKKNGIVLVFPEGITEHNWHFKPVGSATARIIQHALSSDPLMSDTLQLIPVGFTYNDYRHPAKTVMIRTGEPIFPGRTYNPEHAVEWKRSFSDALYRQLLPLIPAMHNEETGVRHYWQTILTNPPEKADCDNTLSHLKRIGESLTSNQISTVSSQKIKSPFFLNVDATPYPAVLKALLYSLPALLGLLLNGVFYFSLERFAIIKTRNTIFHDSLLIGLITVLYPLYTVILSVVLGNITGISAFLWLLLFPLSGWCTRQFWVYYWQVRNRAKLAPEELKSIQSLLQGEMSGETDASAS